MKKYKSFGFIVLLLGICAGGLGAVSADFDKSITVASGNEPSPQTLIFNRKLTSTSMVVGNDFKDIGAGKVAIDSPVKFTCPAGGCTVAAEIHVQFGLNTTSGNIVGLCADLDGSDMPPQGCPVAGTVPADNSFAAFSFEFAQSAVTAGQHTLQSFAFTQSGARRSRYLITYRLYTP